MDSGHMVALPNPMPLDLNQHRPKLQVAGKRSNKMQMERIEDQYDPIYGQQTTPYSSTSYFNLNTLSSEQQQQPSISTTSTHYSPRIISQNASAAPQHEIMISYPTDLSHTSKALPPPAPSFYPPQQYPHHLPTTHHNMNPLIGSPLDGQQATTQFSSMINDSFGIEPQHQYPLMHSPSHSMYLNDNRPKSSQVANNTYNPATMSIQPSNIQNLCSDGSSSATDYATTSEDVPVSHQRQLLLNDPLFLSILNEVRTPSSNSNVDDKKSPPY